MLRFIEENYQCDVDIREDGVAYIYGPGIDICIYICLHIC
jgi:hypothetical protein